MPARYAVLIGINAYPHYGEKLQLSGCVNDALRMKTVLVEHFGFDDANIKELHDTAASRQGILDAMDWLVDVAEPDDIIVFHYSGHGRRRLAKLRKNTELRPTDGEWFDKSEGTRFDSTLMPSDTGPRPHPHLDITDNTINDWLRQLTAITTNVTLVFDACHSGTVTRSTEVVEDKARTVPPDDRPPEELPDDGSLADAKKGRSGWLPLSGRYTVISGSRDSETSKEANVSGGSPYNRHGLLSYYLTQALIESVPGTTHRDIFDVVGRQVTDRNERQHPQIEGSLDREIFGEKVVKPMRFVAVDAVDEGTVTLAGGAIVGLTNGTRWSVYPPSTKQTEGTTATGSIEIVEVGPLTATAKIVESGGDVVPGSRCVADAPETDQYAMRLALQNPASKLKVQFNLYRVLDNGELESADDPDFEFTEGDRVAFRLVNNDPTTVFASLMNFGFNSEIKHLYPRRKACELIAGERDTLVGAQRAKLRVNLRGFDGDKGEIFYKAFFATRPIDLMWLGQDAATPAKVKARQVSAKGRTRSSSPKPDENPNERIDWNAITRRIVVRRRAG